MRSNSLLYADQIAESEAAEALGKQTKDVRNLLPPELDLLWDWALEQPQNVLLKVLAVAVAHTVNVVRGPHDDASTGRLAAADALARALTPDMASWWQPTAANYFVRIYRHGETISTAFVESAINQVVSKRMVKKQQMRWTDRGAHLLLQVRTRVLNEEWRSTLSHWYPAMQETADAKAA